MRRPSSRLMALAIAGLAIPSAGCVEPEPSDRPDLSGWWVWESPQNGEPPFLFFDAPFKGQTAEVVAGVKEAFRQAKLPDLAELGVDQRGEYCGQPRFDGFNGGFADAVEFLFTPARLTITSEGGLIRRVPLDGSALPETVEESNAGTSVGHWEGRTLVVETTGVREGKPFITFDKFISFGNTARFTERLTRRDSDTLEIALHIVAPKVLERPYDTTLIYVRDHGHVFSEYTECVDNDPSFEAASGRQKLDLTPPPDLPPPPTD